MNPLRVIDNQYAGKIKKSKLLVTINTNKTTKFIDKDKFNECIKDTFSNNDNMKKIIKIKIPSHDHSDKFVGDTYVIYATEIGPKFHRVHSHVLLDITHKTNLHVDIPMLKQLIKLTCPEIDGDFKVDIRVIKDDTASVINYLRKMGVTENFINRILN